MAPIRKMGSIIVTHYANPQLFWFKYKNDASRDEFLANLENNIACRMQELQRSCSHSPKIGEIVLVRYSLDTFEHKWIRARVDHQLTNGVTYILWAVDYGFTLKSECRWIRQLLSDELQIIHEKFIFKGGLYNIVPATLKFDFDRNDKAVVETKKWSPIAIEFVEKFIYEADTLTFRCSAYLDDHLFGTLIAVLNTGEKKDVLLDLRNRQECKDSRNFVKDFKRQEQQPYWEWQNPGTRYPIKENSNLHLGDNRSAATYSPTHKINSTTTSTSSTTKINSTTSKNSQQELTQFDQTSTSSIENKQTIVRAEPTVALTIVSPTKIPTKMNSTTSINSQRELTQFDQTITSSVESKQTIVPARPPVAPTKVTPTKLSSSKVSSSENSSLRPIIMVPMNKRLAIARQLLEKKERKKLNMKDEGKIECETSNKKFAPIVKLHKEMKFLPAGFLEISSSNRSVRKKDQSVNQENNDTWIPQLKTVTKASVGDENTQSMDEKSILCSTIKLSNTESHFTKALNDECW